MAGWRPWRRRVVHRAGILPYSQPIEQQTFRINSWAETRAKRATFVCFRARPMTARSGSLLRWSGGSG